MDNLWMTPWTPKSAWTVSDIAKALRQRGEGGISLMLMVRAQLVPVPSFQLLRTFHLYCIMGGLRRQAAFARREARELAQNVAVQGHEEVQECLLRIERDYELLELVSRRDNVPWSVYQLEEMDAILERIRRSYLRAAECLTA